MMGSHSLSLIEVRSWRPEQCGGWWELMAYFTVVSMKSGLGDRNNFAHELLWTVTAPGSSQ